MRNHVLLENCVVSLETHTFVSVLREKQEQTVRKQVGTNFKFVAEKVTLVAFDSFCYLPGLKLSARTVKLYSPLTEIFVLHPVEHMCFIDTPHEDHCFRNLCIPDLYTTYT